MMERFRPLAPADIEVKVKQVSENGAGLLLYKTARTDMDILDESVGAENWECDYREIKGNLYCGIGIRSAPDENFVWKWDCGIESREDDEGNQKKGEASDAFKRAGFKWGIGRELYTGPFIWLRPEVVTIKAGRNGKPTTFDHFSVTDIGYDDQRRISKLVIRNDSMRRVCFQLGDSRSQTSGPVCQICGGEIMPYDDGKKAYTAEQMAERSKEMFGKNLCAKCSKVMGKKAAEEGRRP